jgi:hypothetical protein
MSVPNLFFDRPLPKLPSSLLFSIIGIGKGRQDVLPAPTDLLSLPQNKIRAGKLLIDSGHLQEEHLGGCPHYRYTIARHPGPVVDRVLQKKTQIADDHVCATNFLALLNLLKGKV